MARTEIMSDINDTITQIRSCCDYVDNSLDASYVANNIEMWLDQLRNEIDKYDDSDEE